MRTSAATRKLISAGNATGNDRVALILMDYAHRRRLKILGHIRFDDASVAAPELLAAVALPDYRAQVERAAVIEVAAFDWNCPRHITPGSPRRRCAPRCSRSTTASRRWRRSSRPCR